MKRIYDLLNIPPKKYGCKHSSTCKMTTSCINCNKMEPKISYPSLTPFQINKLLNILLKYDKVVITSQQYIWNNICGDSLNDFIYNILLSREELRCEICSIIK